MRPYRPLRCAHAVPAALALALGACTSGLLPSVELNPFAKPDTPRLREVPADALVGADGRCGEANEEPTGGGVALEMTECDVVRRVGIAEKVDLGANERGERTAVLTYLGGLRPGIYRFVAGRLVSIERAPEPPAPSRPARKKKPART